MSDESKFKKLDDPQFLKLVEEHETLVGLLNALEGHSFEVFSIISHSSIYGLVKTKKDYFLGIEINSESQHNHFFVSTLDGTAYCFTSYSFHFQGNHKMIH